MKAWNKGKKFPHTEEWEKKRIAACRASAIGRRGIPTGRPPTEKVKVSLRDWRMKNPDKVRFNAIRNLPKDCNGEKNGNWKGGISRIRNLKFTNDHKKWRQRILARDRICRICGTTFDLQAHHIIPVSECPEIAFLDMNGVILCREHHYENDEAWKGKRYPKEKKIGTTFSLIFTIPHKFQSYPTVGNWSILESGAIIIFVSDTGKETYNHLIAFHELWEAILCKKRGISQKCVDDFDKRFERNRSEDNLEEPGDQPDAPYQNEHCSATGVERILCALLGIKWKEYDQAIMELP